MTGMMTDILRLSSVILAARRGNDEGGWVQLLIFLVMIVFFVISNIAKARSEKRQQGQGKVTEEPLLRLRRRFIAQPKAPAIGKKIFSQKIPQPPVTEAVPIIQQIEEPTAAQLAAVPEATKHTATILPVELIALEKRDELAKGIIYSAILGKPLALREKWGYE
jgi:hypothetical protein